MKKRLSERQRFDINTYVGKVGLEPTCDQLLFLQGISLRRYLPILGTPDRIRTYDLQIRSLLLYPTELLVYIIYL